MTMSGMSLHLCLFLYLLKTCLSTTSITTFPTVNLTENTPINTKVQQLTAENDRLKLVLLNLGGFETHLFSIINGSVYTINEIDREQLLGEKRCFDRSYCSIELHVLVDDGRQYWVIPVHIVDVNDNKPQFKRSSINLRFDEKIVGGYKIPFEGAKDIDEGVNGEVHYLLDCSTTKHRLDKSLIVNQHRSSINCLSLFELIILSQSPPSSSSSPNQYDQLALKFNPSSLSHDTLQNDYHLTLYGIDGAQNGKELFSSMNINIHIDKILKKPTFSLSNYRFVVEVNSSVVKRGRRVGSVSAQTSDASKVISYRIINKTNVVEMNSFSGELFLSNDIDSLPNEMNLTIEASYLTNDQVKSFAKVQIFVRSSDEVKNVWLKYETPSSLIHQMNESNRFAVDEDVEKDEVLFKMSVVCSCYPSDRYNVLLENYHSTFSLVSSSSTNNYILKTRRNLISKLVYLLSLRIQHQLTEEWLPNLTIELFISYPLTTTMSMITVSDILQPLKPLLLVSSFNCLENSTYTLRDVHNRTQIAKLKVIESNSSVSSFSTYYFIENDSEININECRMYIEEFDQSYLNQSRYQLCSSSSSCSNITLTNHNSDLVITKNSLTLLGPVEMAMLTVSLVFILATMTLMVIICRLRGLHLCLTIKNYLFYGKKYGLSHAQRLSSAKMTQRVHSIVVRESQSPSPDHVKPYMYRIDERVEQETVPPINRFGESCTSSLQCGDRTISNVETDLMTPRTSSLSFVQETKQLLDILSLNHELDMSRLSSEV